MHVNLPYIVNRSILIKADQHTVFSFFTDPARWSAWWGAGSTVEPHVGGAIKIRHSNGFESVGHVLEIDPPKRFAFTFSMQSGEIIPPEDSRVTLTLEPGGAGTLVSVAHEVADREVSELLPQGWRFHFSMFANAIANVVYADASAIADEWFSLWAEPNAERRNEILHKIAARDVHFRDRYSHLDGIDEVVLHIGASQKFMPGIRLERRGNVRHCQGTALADWTAVKDGKEMTTGTNVFVFGAAGKLESITGIANAS